MRTIMCAGISPRGTNCNHCPIDWCPSQSPHYSGVRMLQCAPVPTLHLPVYRAVDGTKGVAVLKGGAAVDDAHRERM